MISDLKGFGLSSYIKSDILLSMTLIIVVELAWTNSPLEKSIEAAEGSRAASEWMCSGLELFLQQQREFQALLFKKLRLDPQITLDKAQMGPV
jgi:hypothetical protein